MSYYQIMKPDQQKGLREDIVETLSKHPDGLTAKQIRMELGLDTDYSNNIQSALRSLKHKVRVLGSKKPHTQHLYRIRKRAPAARKSVATVTQKAAPASLSSQLREKFGFKKELGETVTIKLTDAQVLVNYFYTTEAQFECDVINAAINVADAIEGK